MAVLVAVAHALLTLATVEASPSPPPKLDVVLLIDFSKAPPQGEKHDRPALKRATRALLDALSSSGSAASLRVYPFAGKLAEKPLLDIDTPLETGRVYGMIEAALSRADANKEYVDLELYSTDIASALDLAGKLARRRPWQFPVLLVVSNGIDDPGPHRTQHVECQRQDEPKLERQGRLYGAVHSLRRRTVFFMTPCKQSSVAGVLDSTFPFLDFWSKKHFDALTVLPSWPPSIATAISTEAAELEDNARTAIRELRPPIYLRPPDPIIVHRSGDFIAKLQSDATRLAQIKLCVRSVHPKPEAATSSSPSGRVRIELLKPLPAEPSCTITNVVPGEPIAVPLQFHDDADAGAAAARPPVGATISLRVNRATRIEPDLDLVLHPRDIELDFHYVWPSWWVEAMFSPLAKWPLLGAWVMALGLLFLSGLYRFWGIGSNRWVVNVKSRDVSGSLEQATGWRCHHVIAAGNLVDVTPELLKRRPELENAVLRLWPLGEQHIALKQPAGTPARRVEFRGYDRGRDDKRAQERQVLTMVECQTEDHVRITFDRSPQPAGISLTWQARNDGESRIKRALFSCSIRRLEYVKIVTLVLGTLYLSFGAFLIHLYRLDEQGWLFAQFVPCLSLLATATHAPGLWGAIKRGAEVLERATHLAH